MKTDATPAKRKSTPPHPEDAVDRGQGHQFREVGAGNGATEDEAHTVHRMQVRGSAFAAFSCGGWTSGRLFLRAVMRLLPMGGKSVPSSAPTAMHLAEPVEEDEIPRIPRECARDRRYPSPGHGTGPSPGPTPFRARGRTRKATARPARNSARSARQRPWNMSGRAATRSAANRSTGGKSPRPPENASKKPRWKHAPTSRDATASGSVSARIRPRSRSALR